MITERDPDWRTRASCLSLHPDEFCIGSGCHPGPALKICNRCPVRRDCLAFTFTLRPLDRRSIVAGGWYFDRSGKARPHPRDVTSGLAAQLLQGANA